MPSAVSTMPPATGGHPLAPGPAPQLPRLPGSTQLVLLLCAQAGLTVTPRPARYGFHLWLLADDPDTGFGCLGLDAAGRVVAVQLFDGLDDPRLVADPEARAHAHSRGYSGVVAALTRFRNTQHQIRPQHPDLPEAQVGGCHRAA